MSDKKRRFWDVKSYFKTEDANAVDKYGLTQIFEAARKDKTDDIKQLIQDGADIDYQFRRVADPGMTLNPFRKEPNIVEGSTPLHVAVISGHIRTLKVLMEQGAKLNTQDLDGCTPLDRALERFNKLDEEITADNSDKKSKASKKKALEHTLYKAMAKILARNGAEAKVFTMSEKLKNEIDRDFQDLADFSEPARKKRRIFTRIRIDF